MNARWQKILVLGWLLASAAWLAWAWPRSLALALGGWAIAASTSLAWLGLQFVLMRRINRRDATPAAGRWALLRAWWLEALTCTWVFGWLQPFAHRQQPDWLPPTPTGQRGVVLVHGFLCNRGVWLPWLPELRARGHAYVALTLEPAFGSVDDYVAAIDTALAELNAAWQAASQDIYAAQQQQGGAQQGAPHADAGAGTNGQQQGGSNQPEDVEFEEVK